MPATILAALRYASHNESNGSYNNIFAGYNPGYPHKRISNNGSYTSSCDSYASYDYSLTSYDPR